MGPGVGDDVDEEDADPEMLFWVDEDTCPRPTELGPKSAQIIVVGESSGKDKR